MHNLNEEIGARIATLRKANGMTQEKLAEKLNCSIKHISHVERGVASLSLDLLIEAGDIFDCSLDYLIKGETVSPEVKLPTFVLQILGSSDSRMAKERVLLTNYLNMYRILRENNLPGRQ
ncbi:MAG: helix-turn-helix transcriptional regulator [Eubacteriales bacterium]|nr:helix-turn-helix transcriptional regulator [Eubacteriales bacterium]